MKTTAVICEYNPLHNGHAKQLAAMREKGSVVCLMSGNYVQRGEPAVFDAYTRARAAMACGADLVLELPLTYSLRSAEGFADGGVEILHRMGCIDTLCFGSEQGSAEQLMETAALLRSEEFADFLRQALQSGVSFPTARSKALERLLPESKLLRLPNATLGVEYCKAILQYESNMELLVLHRDGDYHQATQKEAPSATVLRSMADWTGYVPETVLPLYADAKRYSLAAGERALLSRLRFMTEQDFASLPFGSEGLWRKLMQACRSGTTAAEILNAAKSKRYTHTRLMRMLLCAYLGITEEILRTSAPYVRILAANAEGQRLLRRAKKQGTVTLVNAGQKPPDAAYGALERRAADLYALFCETALPEIGQTRKQRIYLDRKE